MAGNSSWLSLIFNIAFSASGKLEDRETRGGKLEAGNSTITHLSTYYSNYLNTILNKIYFKRLKYFDSACELARKYDVPIKGGG